MQKGRQKKSIYFNRLTLSAGFFAKLLQKERTQKIREPLRDFSK
jgi:hypothetical protein